MRQPPRHTGTREQRHCRARTLCPCVLRCCRVSGRAFTLLELLLVMIILAIVAGVAAPSLRGFGIGRQTDNAANLIASLAQYAHSQAIAQGRTYHLNVDPAAGEVWLSAQGDDGSYVPLTGDFGRRFQLDQNIHLQTDLPLQADGQYAQFPPTGRTTPAQITLSDSTGRTITVACLSATEPFRIISPAEASP